MKIRKILSMICLLTLSFVLVACGSSVDNPIPSANQGTYVSEAEKLGVKGEIRVTETTAQLIDVYAYVSSSNQVIGYALVTTSPFVFDYTISGNTVTISADLSGKAEDAQGNVYNITMHFSAKLNRSTNIITLGGINYIKK